MEIVISKLRLKIKNGDITMNKKIVLPIIAIIAVIAATSLIYVFYIADYTYEDDNIQITVPTQTKFVKNATTSGAWTLIEYNSSDKNDIYIRLMKLDNNQNMSLFGIQLNLFGIAKNVAQQSLLNASFEKLEVNSNYTIYYNKEKNRYATLFFNENLEVITIIYCNDLELIKKLAGSFELKGFSTEGLTVVNKNETPVTPNTTNTTITPTTTSKNTSSNTNTGKTRADISPESEKYLEEDEPIGWTEEDYLDATEYDYSEYDYYDYTDEDYDYYDY